MSELSVTLRDVYAARARISGIAVRTPFFDSAELTNRTGSAIYLKLENVQRTGAFKIRGAANRLRNLSSAERDRGVVTVSSGNHGRAVAYVAQELGIRAVVCVSMGVPPNKVDAIQKLGAEVVRHGESYDEAEDFATKLQLRHGLTMIPPFDDPHVIAGQGTIALELLEEHPELDTVIVPLSGGGLLSGVALTMKSADPSIRTIGVSMARAPVMYHSLRAGHPIEMEEESTLADALMGGIGLENKYTFDLIRQYVDDTLLVSEDDIANAMVFALEHHHVVVEGGGAVALAAVLCGKVKGLGKHVAVIVSGGNVEIPVLVDIVQRHLGSGPGCSDNC